MGLPSSRVTFQPAQAVLATLDLGWQLAHDDLAEVRADGGAHVPPHARSSSNAVKWSDAWVVLIGDSLSVDLHQLRSARRPSRPGNSLVGARV
jgi:hypothetical protein